MRGTQNSIGNKHVGTTRNNGETIRNHVETTVPLQNISGEQKETIEKQAKTMCKRLEIM